MKLLFVCDNAYHGDDSTSNIVKVLLDYLKKRHDIFVLTRRKYRDGLSACFKEEGINYCLFRPFDFSAAMDTYLFKYYDWGRMKKKEKIFFLICHPGFLWRKILYRILGFKRFKREYLFNKRIKRLDKKYKFDAVIAIAVPYDNAKALAKANVYGKKIIYELDPHYTNYYCGKGKDKAYLREEQQVLENIDLALMTDLIYNENQNNELKKYKNKMRWLEYPNVRNLDFYAIKQKEQVTSKKINCFFIGSFYDEIRNPKFVLDTFLRMNNKSIVFHFVGDVVGDSGETEIKKYKKLMGERLVIHGRKTRDEALFMMKNADILVGVNNSIKNQLPGKIFDYISCGRPILNFCYLDDCPSLKYTKKYPLALDIFEKQEIDINGIEVFCEKNKGEFIPYEEIRALFEENTIEVVGEEFDKLIRECVKNNSK